MDFFKKITIGIIVGLVLMCARRYLFLNVSAATISSKPILNQFIYYRGNGTGYAANSSDGLGANLSASTIGENSYDGNFSWTFRMPQNVYVPKNSHIFFDIAVEMSYPVHYGLVVDNDKYSIGRNGNMYGGGNNYACDVSVQMFDVKSYTLYNPTSSVFVETDGVSQGGSLFSIINTAQNLKAVYSFDCYIDDDITLTMSNGNVVFNTPPMSIPYYWWSYGSRGFSNIMIQKDNMSILIDSVNTGNNAINDSLDDIKDSDISSSSKDSVDDTEMNNYSSKESDLFDSTDSNYSVEDTLDVGLDANGSQFLWDTISRFIRTHGKVFGCVISMLSLGIIKLILGR